MAAACLAPVARGLSTTGTPRDGETPILEFPGLSGLASRRTASGRESQMTNEANVARRAVLLGVGNILLTDEGVGVRLVEQLERDYRLAPGLTVLDGGTAAMELLEDLEDLDLLVIADCVRVGQPPASVVVLKDAAVPSFFRARLSPHQVGLSDVLATLEITERAPHHVVVVGVQPVDVSLGLEQSEAVRAVMPEALAAIRAALADYGYECPARERRAAA